MKHTTQHEYEQQAATLIKSALRAYVAFKRFQRKWRIFIPEASRTNIRRLQSSVLPLSQIETNACQMLADHLVYSHASQDLELIQQTGHLASLRIRQHQNGHTGNRNTAQSNATDGNVFATTELGNQPAPPKFLGDQVDFLRINPRDYQKHAPNSTIRFAWVSPHLSEYVHGSEHHVAFGSTQFHFCHHKDGLQKTTTYTYQDGSQTTIDQHFAEEIFYGGDITLGLGLRLIQHLRQLNNAYSDYLLTKLADHQIPLPQRVDHLFSVLKHLSPTPMYPECKIPGTLSLDNPGITIKHQKQHKQMESSLRYIHFFMKEPVFHQEDAQTEQDLALVYIQNGHVDRLRALHHLSEFVAAIDQEKKGVLRHAIIYNRRNPDTLINMIQLLIDHGAPLYDDHYSESPLNQAIEDHCVELVEHLLTLNIHDPMDPHLTRRIKINHGHLSPYSDPISHACRKGHLDIIELLAQNGGNLERDPAYWINLAATRNHLHIVQYFMQCGFYDALRQNAPNQPSALLSFAKHNNLTAVECVLPYSDIQKKHPYQETDFEFGVLHYAALNNNAEMVHLLCHGGEIDVDELSASQETALSIALNLQHTEAATALREHGADARLTLDHRPNYESYQHQAVAIVTGRDARGQRVVFLGKKWTRNRGIWNQYFFPGGLKNQEKDADFIDTAARELMEETGFPAPMLIECGALTAQILYQYTEGVAKKCVSTAFVHFDCGDQLNDWLDQYPITAQDDLAQIDVIPIHQLVENINKQGTERFSILNDTSQSTPITISNAFALQLLELNAQSAPNSGKIKQKKREIHLACRHYHFRDELMKIALKDHDLSLVQTLIDHGATLNQIVYSSDFRERTFLFGYACQVSSLEIVQLLSAYMDSIDFLAHPIDLTVRENPNAMFILQWLHQQQLVTPAGALVGLHSAIENGATDIAHYIIEHFPDIIEKLLPGKQYPLSAAVKHGQASVVKSLLDAGVSPNLKATGELYQGILIDAPLLLAIEAKNPAIFQLLIDHGADVNVLIKTDKELLSLRRLQYSMGQQRGQFSLNPMAMFEHHIREEQIRVDLCPLMAAIRANQEEMVHTLYHHPDIDLKQAAETVRTWQQRKNSLDGYKLSPAVIEYMNKLLGHEIVCDV